MFKSINPYTEKCFSQRQSLSDSQLEKSLALGVSAGRLWRQSALKERAELVLNLKKSLGDHKTDLAQLMVQEMGKPLSQAEAEIEKCQLLCEYTSQYALDFLSDKTSLPSAPDGAYVMYEPLGLILGIMPWNFPCWQVLRFALPALLSGNAVLIKPAPNVMEVSFLLNKIFKLSGFLENVYQTLPISVSQTEKVIADFRVQGLSLTGSVKAGRATAELAGRHLKKSVLELGGSDPYLILDSVDLPLAAEQCVYSRMNNSGQSCIAAKRWIVTAKNSDSFIELAAEEMKKFKMADPLLPDTRLGPLARKDLRDHLHKQVKTLLRKGAEKILGAEKPKRKGYFYPPTVLSVSAERLKSFVSDKEIWEQELFGPVALILVVSDEEEGIAAANASSFGLGSAVFGADKEQAENIAREKLQAGACAVNSVLHSHPALPFGGIKNSGYGREMSMFGFYEFVNVKTVCVKA